MSERRETVRERIVQEFKRRLEAMTPEAEDYLKWDAVTRAKLSEAAEEKQLDNLVGLYDINESYQPLASLMECTLCVQVEYWYKVAIDADAGTEGERIRGNLVQALTKEQALKESETGAVLTRLIVLTRSDKDSDPPRAETIGGFIEFNVIYRHRLHDPHSLTSAL